MTPREILIAYSREQASTEAVMRALVSYNGWLADASFGVHATGQNNFERVLILSTTSNVRDGELWFFTDEAAVHAATARGAQLGTYVSGISGTQLFAALPGNFQSVTINIGSPQAESWFIPQEAFAQASLWARAIGVETHLTAPDSPEKFAAMRDYPGYIYLIYPEQDAIVTAVGMGGRLNPAIVFTAIDCAQTLTAEHPHLQPQFVDGRTLFSRLPSQGVDGVVFNPLGPGPQAVFDLSICDRIAGL